VLSKLFNALDVSRSKIKNALSFISGSNISEDDIDKLEEDLILTDMGYDLAHEVIDLVKKTAGSDIGEAVLDVLTQKLPGKNNWQSLDNPSAIVVVGVNGSGKTTSAAKLASLYKGLGHEVTLIAADTYRAAAIDQLKIWSERIDCRLVYNEKTSEPVSVIFDGLESARSRKSDLAIIDTAGRLHTSKNLMAELEKMYRVIDKRFPEYSINSLITIDASMGQNSIDQATEFNNNYNLNGAILTKLDGTAKGGVVFPLFDRLGIPVKFVGTGEGVNDLEPFDRDIYVNALLGVAD
tara:strand:- start:103 stop:984 length:882 start_codon:yes stop_codon:yes gene_type:complete